MEDLVKRFTSYREKKIRKKIFVNIEFFMISGEFLFFNYNTKLNQTLSAIDESGDPYPDALPCESGEILLGRFSK